MNITGSDVIAELFHQTGKDIFLLGASLLIQVAEVTLVLLGWELKSLNGIVVQVHAELDTLSINVLWVI